ncbi:DsrE family protein [Sunxiuqinia sp. A32]|uniref:DsrE family protein n=1 Tax=Sunxiuqinia sp. A32 TaxID=3461496 RepID=UPI004045F465
MKQVIFILLAVIFLNVSSQASKNSTMNDNSNKLAVLWTSGDPDVAEKVCFMYTNNAKKQGWFDEVVLIVWGPSSKLLTENKMLQEYIKTMQQNGVKIEACYYCAEMYGVVDNLKAMDIDVKGMGVPLTNYLKDGWHTLTF